MESISKPFKKEITKITEINKEALKGWDEAFKQAIANDNVPENDMLGAMKNIFDDTEW